MSKEQKIDHVVWTNRKVRREVQLLSGASVLILSLMTTWRFTQGEVQAHTAFGIGLGLGIILALLLFSMAPMILVKKLEGGGAIEG